MTDVLKRLPPFEWRGRRYPLVSRSVSFAHEGASHQIQYRDGTFIEQTGRRSFTFNYGIPMREDIAKGPYKNLFVEGLPKLLRDCLNRTPGALIDPVYGPFRCVPTSFNDDADPNKRDGTDIRIEFTHSPEFAAQDSSESENIAGLSALVADSGQLDQQLTKADWKQEPSPEGGTDILSAINGIGRQTLGAVDKISAGLDDYALKLEKIEQTADRAENPQNWRLRDSVRRAREATVRLKRRASEDPVKRVITVTRRVNSTISSVAADLDMTVEELLRLNPFLAKSPMVPAGTVITGRIARL